MRLVCEEYGCLETSSEKFDKLMSCRRAPEHESAIHEIKLIRLSERHHTIAEKRPINVCRKAREGETHYKRYAKIGLTCLLIVTLSSESFAENRV